MHRVRSNNMANASTSTSSSVADRDWNDVMRYAEQLLHERVRREIAKVSDDPDAIKEFVETKGVYVVGSTVAWAMAKAKGYAGDELPADLNIYAKNPLLVARTDIGVRHLGTLKKHSCVAQRCYAGEGPNNNGRCTDNTKPYDDSARRILDISGKVFADIEAAVRGFDSDIYHAAYDVAANRLVPCSDRWTRLMKMDAGAVFTYYMDYAGYRTPYHERTLREEDARRAQTESRAKNWFRGTCKFSDGTFEDTTGKDEHFLPFCGSGKKHRTWEINYMKGIELDDRYYRNLDSDTPAMWRCVLDTKSKFQHPCYQCGNVIPYNYHRAILESCGQFDSVTDLCPDCSTFADKAIRSILHEKVVDYRRYTEWNYDPQFGTTELQRHRDDFIPNGKTTLTLEALKGLEDKSAHSPILTFTFLLKYKMVRDRNAEGFIIITPPANGNALDYYNADHLVRTVFNKFAGKNDRLIKKKINRIAFVGYSERDALLIRRISHQMAAVNCQVLIWKGNVPRTPLEWGAVFVNLTGLMETDDLAYIRNEKGSKTLIYPDACKDIDFKTTMKIIFKNRVLPAAVKRARNNLRYVTETEKRTDFEMKTADRWDEIPDEDRMDVMKSYFKRADKNRYSYAYGPYGGDEPILTDNLMSVHSDSDTDSDLPELISIETDESSDSEDEDSNNPYQAILKASYAADTPNRADKRKLDVEKFTVPNLHKKLKAVHSSPPLVDSSPPLVVLNYIKSDPKLASFWKKYLKAVEKGYTNEVDEQNERDQQMDSPESPDEDEDDN